MVKELRTIYLTSFAVSTQSVCMVLHSVSMGFVKAFIRKPFASDWADDRLA